MNKLDEQIAKCKLLTAREIDVFKLRVQSLTRKKIADTLYISESTVQLHLGHIYEKLDIDPLSTYSQAQRFSELKMFAEALDVLAEKSSQSDTTPSDAEELEPQQPSSTALVRVLEDEVELVKRDVTAAIEPSVIRIPFPFSFRYLSVDQKGNVTKREP